MKTTGQQRVLVALKIVIVTTNCLLILQFLLGMIVNLFATLPFDQIDVTSGSFVEKTGLAIGYARTSDILALQLHWLNACLLILSSIALIILGMIAKKKRVWILALLLSVIFSVASVSGGAFIAYAGSNYYSFSMATAFLIAAILAVCLLFAIFSKGKGKTPAYQGPQESFESRSLQEMAKLSN